jgi:predicted nucleic acid-binding protein
MPVTALFDSSAVILYFNDALIAATALLHTVPVVTANARDFERVGQLQVLRL